MRNQQLITSSLFIWGSLQSGGPVRIVGLAPVLCWRAAPGRRGQVGLQCSDLAAPERVKWGCDGDCLDQDVCWSETSGDSTCCLVLGPRIAPSKFSYTWRKQVLSVVNLKVLNDVTFVTLANIWRTFFPTFAWIKGSTLQRSLMGWPHKNMARTETWPPTTSSIHQNTVKNCK